MDFEAIHASVGEERKKYLRQLDEAWSHHGAIYIINHSIGTETLEEAFAWVSGYPRQTQVSGANSSRAVQEVL
jgi:isopenicillin N synthase-like dioxygenase